MEKAPDFYKSRAFRFGGLGRNRTTDTRIFKTTPASGEATTKPKNFNSFSPARTALGWIFRTDRRTGLPTYPPRPDFSKQINVLAPPLPNLPNRLPCPRR